MLRTAVTAWFALAAVLGPALCCCPKATAHAAPTPAKKCHSCCHTPADPRPTQPADDCPCPMRTGVAEYTAVERTAVDDAADFQPLASFRTVGEWAVEPVAVRTRPDPDDGPPISGQYLLALFQILLI